MVVGVILSVALAVGSVGFAYAMAAERHPHIHEALKELREAHKELKEADHDFGGHREEALKSVNHAIEQLEKALKFAK
jgi:F0F1-type ATP synthase membrane subunit b/b'